MGDGIYQVAGSGNSGESCGIRSRATCLNLGILDHQHCHAFWTILASDGGALLYITASTSFVRMSATAHMETRVSFKSGIWAVAFRCIIIASNPCVITMQSRSTNKSHFNEEWMVDRVIYLFHVEKLQSSN
jgi:hypothetical protein